MITSEAFQEWKANPTTIEVYKDMTRLKTILGDDILDGNTLGTTADETALLTARIVGKIEGIREFLEYKVEDKDAIIKGEEE